MANGEFVDWQGDFQEYYAGDGVTITKLLNPRGEFSYDERFDLHSREYNPTRLYLAQSATLRSPGNSTPDWEVKETDHSLAYGDEHAPMNSALRSRFYLGGFISTGNLSGCVALGAAYRDEKDGVQAYLSHYDAESVRTTDDNGKLRAANMFRDFAGSNAVRAVLAYSSVLDRPRRSLPYDPEEFPIEAWINEFKELPEGSQVVLLPYENDLENPKGNVFYVGSSPAIDFGWNGHRIHVGEQEQSNGQGIERFRADFAPLAAALDDRLPDDDEFDETLMS